AGDKLWAAIEMQCEPPEICSLSGGERVCVQEPMRRCVPQFPAKRLDQKAAEIEYQIGTEHIDEHAFGFSVGEQLRGVEFTLDSIVVDRDDVHAPLTYYLAQRVLN